MGDNAITVHGLGKQLRRGAQQEPYRTLREDIMRLLRAPSRWAAKTQADLFWALRDISFAVSQGEVVGVIGQNGAGKSTLLKILARITEPTTGVAEIRGRVASMLEVGTGFHPELSGRENVFLNGAVIGMKRAEIMRKFDEIVDFSGVAQFIDTPIKHYSTGMYLRLAFAVAAHLEQEVLLIDEVLAVGDAEFQKKCLQKMHEVATTGRTILFVSHNMAAVERLCKNSVVLRRGELTYFGETKAGITHYLQQADESAEGMRQLAASRPGRGRMRFRRVGIRRDQRWVKTITSAGDVEIVLDYDVHVPDAITNLNIGVVWNSRLGDPLFTCSSEYSGFVFDELRRDGRIVCRIANLPLNEGVYSIGVWLTSNLGLEDSVDLALEVAVQGGDYFGTGRTMPPNWGPMLVPHTFELVDTDVTTVAEVLAS